MYTNICWDGSNHPSLVQQFNKIVALNHKTDVETNWQSDFIEFLVIQQVQYFFLACVCYSEKRFATLPNNT